MLDISLFKLIKDMRSRVYLSAAFSLLDFLSDLAFFFGLVWLFASIYFSASISGSCLLMVFTSLFSAVFKYLKSRSADKLGGNIRTKLRIEVFQKAERLGRKTFRLLPESSLTQLTTEGVESLDTYFSSFIPTFFYAMISPVLVIVLLLAFHFGFAFSSPLLWVVAIVYAVTIPLIPVSIVGVSRFAKRIFAKYWNRYLQLGGTFADALNGLKDLKNFNTAEFKGQKLDKEAEEFRKATMKVLVMQLWSTCIMDTVAYGGSAILMAIGLAFAFDGNQAELWFSALLIVLVSLRFYLPLRRMGSQFHVAMNGATAGRKILSFLEEKEPRWGNKSIEIQGVKFKNVSYFYEDNPERAVLKSISMSLPSTGLIALVGKSGEGKSTLAGLLTRKVDPSSGSIVFLNSNKEEIPLNELSRESFYSQVAFLSTGMNLYPETLKEAFQRFDKEIDDKDIEKALDSVGLTELYQRRNGLYYRLNEDTTDLSGGEKQRLALALALAKKNIRVLILDEASSALDQESSELFLKRVKEASKSALVLLITHRLEQAEIADRVFYLKEGTIAGEGTFPLLLMENKDFSALWEVYSGRKGETI